MLLLNTLKDNHIIVHFNHLIYWVSFIYFKMLDSPCISWINVTSSWCIIYLHHYILFVDILYTLHEWDHPVNIFFLYSSLVLVLIYCLIGCRVVLPFFSFERVFKKSDWRGRGWGDLGEWHWNLYNIMYETSRQSRFDARYWMLGAGALGRPRGWVWGGRREEGSGWGTQVYLWRIHFDIWQN